MTYDDFLTYVLPSVPSCPTPTALHAIRLAANEFCAGSHVWQEDLDPIAADGSSEYTLNVDGEVELVRLLAVKCGDDEFDVVTPLEGKRRVRREQTDKDVAFTSNGREIVLYPAPATGDIEITAVLKPSHDSSEFPDDVFAHHAEHIADGALARLFAMPKTDWTDPALAQYRDGLFRSHIHSAAAGAASGFGGRVRVALAPL